jgi:hypothetical protein
MTVTYKDIRSFMVEELKKDLVGPYKVDEEITEGPTSYYLAGILFPADTDIDPEEDKDSGEAADEGDDEVDTGTLMASAINPSSIGLTFTTAADEKLAITIHVAVYIEEKREKGSSIWKRKILPVKPMILNVSNARNETIEISDGLGLFRRVRVRDEQRIITLSLLNNYKVDHSTRVDPYCFFQPEIIVESIIQGKPVFITQYGRSGSYFDPNRVENELLYRYAPEFAVGHGCSVEWDAREGECATQLRTSVIPSYELLQLTPNPHKHYKALEMLFLSNASSDELLRELQVLPALYREWLSGANLADVPDYLQEKAQQNIQDCDLVATRIEQGIRLISEDEQVRWAFQLANRAMLIQRSRVTWLKKPADQRSPEPVLDKTHVWRPFQLGFILLCLPSIVNLQDPARRLVDLLWFPTGGGKTEAYLGLTAFTIFLRRMRRRGSKESAGVTVLMRYTLRLLTIQQFQRASTLIMACETIRRENMGTLGDDEISLGLWVGGAATPNRLNGAKGALEQLLKGERVLEGNPYQIHSCPWCGTPITPREYRIGVTLVIQCPNADCDFVKALPLYLVDEDIYRCRPSLLIGTVDKFARLPWLEEAGAIFGRPDEKTLPPELIIQDELHLISGPLGSLVGLYETAIDRLCQRDGIPPKIIASTATIRRAAEQSKGLFNRGFSQFPPPALDARDNFFSWQISPDIRPGRLYVGVYAPGKSIKTALLRIYAVLLQRIYEHSADPDLRDPYWTLVGYFNSLRELGGALRLVEDDIRDRMKLLASRIGEKQRQINYYRELNSRIGSDEIPEILDHMSKTITDHSAIDVLLATNMISVGMDIDRLGLMVVNGQPKMTSEYIQATSRIGRQYPGLVVTLYNWTRPRDRSHYERFMPYHASVYSQVEPTSVTPYSNRARDRGLHGVFITIMRHLYPEMNPEEAALNFDPKSTEVKHVIKDIITRVTEIDPVEVNEVKQELEYICARWAALTRNDKLSYRRSYQNPALPHLLEPIEEVHGADILSFPTLNSLRDVEGECGIHYRSYEG